MTAGEIVGRLTKPQRLTNPQRTYLTTKAEWHSPAPWMDKRWMTFPPAATHRVLVREGLVDWNGQLTDAGLEVRALLQADQPA